MPITITDGFTRTTDIKGRPGMHPAVRVVYRPALARVRHEYQIAIKSNDPGRMDAVEVAILTEYVKDVAGDGPLSKAQAERLEPNLRSDLIDLVLSYTPATEQPEETLGKSGPPSGS